jgi:hypothetical protein
MRKRRRTEVERKEAREEVEVVERREGNRKWKREEEKKAEERMIYVLKYQTKSWTDSAQAQG